MYFMWVLIQTVKNYYYVYEIIGNLNNGQVFDIRELFIF